MARGSRVSSGARGDRRRRGREDRREEGNRGTEYNINSQEEKKKRSIDSEKYEEEVVRKQFEISKAEMKRCAVGSSQAFWAILL